MKFLLFSKLPFDVPDPNSLIESHCIQSDFYVNFDLVPVEDREITHVYQIGARVKKKILEEDCRDALANLNAESQSILGFSLDDFVGLDDGERKRHVEEFNRGIVKKLLKIRGIGLSTATKILHTFYPDIIPMIDNPLQNLYRKKVNTTWSQGESQIFIDYYKSLERETINWKNLTKVYRDTEKNGLGLSKVRVFDILWSSFLRAKQLNGKYKKIHLSSIQW